MAEIIKIDEVTGNEEKLRFLALSSNRPDKVDRATIADWVRENVIFAVAPANQEEGVKDHLAVLEAAREQMEKDPLVISAGYAYDPGYYNEKVKRPNSKDAEQPKLVFGSDSLQREGILTGFDVAFELNQVHQKILFALQKSYSDLASKK